MEPLEMIFTTLAIIHTGQKIIDKFWSGGQRGESPVVNQAGNLTRSTTHEGRTAIQKDFTAPQNQPYGLVIGDFYVPDSVLKLIAGSEIIPLVLIVEEKTQESFLFTTNLEQGYEIYLPHGRYYFYVFLMDINANNFFEAYIYAVGFHSMVNLSNFESLEFENHEDVWEILNTSPIGIRSGSQYALDFVLVDTRRVSGFPTCFADTLITGIDQYTKLENLLAGGMWKEADNETARIMCHAVGRDAKGYLRTKHIDHFPCRDLINIDKLWLGYSNGHFGFSVQKNIYQDLVRRRGPSRNTWYCFKERVGWRNEARRQHGKHATLYYPELTFNLYAPKGHLPRSLEIRGRDLGFAGQDQWVALFSRLDTCNYRERLALR